jgi:hypothetical protein
LALFPKTIKYGSSLWVQSDPSKLFFSAVEQVESISRVQIPSVASMPSIAEPRQRSYQIRKYLPEVKFVAYEKNPELSGTW